MKISPVSTFSTKSTNIRMNNFTKRENPIQQPTDSVSFRGIKNAVKGAGILGVVGAVTGAVLSGGTSIIPTIIYFAACDAVVGGAIGAHIEDD